MGAEPPYPLIGIDRKRKKEGKGGVAEKVKDNRLTWGYAPYPFLL